MAEGKLSIPPDDDAEECLHCAIVDMVEERIAAGGADAANLASLIAETLVDVILRVPDEEQAQLMAHTLAALGDLFLQKSGTEGSGSGSTHLTPSSERVPNATFKIWQRAPEDELAERAVHLALIPRRKPARPVWSCRSGLALRTYVRRQRRPAD